MKRSEWKKFIKGFEGISFFDWLSRLPTGNGGTKIKTTPIVCLKSKDRKQIEKKLKKLKMCFADSTLMTVEGYHHPDGTMVKAIVQPCDEWWKEHPNGKFSWIVNRKEQHG